MEDQFLESQRRGTRSSASTRAEGFDSWPPPTRKRPADSQQSRASVRARFIFGEVKDQVGTGLPRKERHPQ